MGRHKRYTANWVPSLAAILGAALCSASIGDQVITDMTPVAVADAIKEGTTAKNVRFYVARGGAFDIGANIGVAYSTPYVRVAFAANEAKRRYKPFTETDVTVEMKAPELRVYAPAWAASDRRTIVSPEAIVVLQGGDKGSVIQPTSTQDMTEEFQNLFGAKSDGHSMVAAFPLSVLKDGNVIRVVWNIGKEMSHKISTKNIR